MAAQQYVTADWHLLIQRHLGNRRVSDRRKDIMFHFVRRLPSCANLGIQFLSTRSSCLRLDISISTFGVRDYRRSNKSKATPNATKSTLIHDLVARIPDADADLNTDAIMDAFQSMKPNPLPKEFLRRREFIDFCQRIEHSANQFTADEAVDILCRLHALGVPIDAKIRQRLVRVIQVNIADLNVEGAIRLGNILHMSRSGENILSGAIQIVLPILLIKKLPERLSDEGLSTELLKFVAMNNQQQQPHRELFEYAINALLNAELSVDQAMNVFHASLQLHSDFQESDLYVEFMLKITDVVAQDLQAFTSKRLEVFVKIYAGLCSRRRQLLNERFFDAIANYAIEIEPDFDMMICFLYYFHKAGYHSTNLLGIFIESIERNPELCSTARNYQFPKMITCIAMAASLPENWTTTIWPAIELNPVYQNRDTSVNWLSITRQLIAMGFYDVHSISEMLSKSYLDNLLGKKSSDLAYLEFLDVFQDCMLNRNICGNSLDEIDTGMVEKAISIKLEQQTRPFQSRFEEIFGTDKLISSVRSQFGHYIQHVMKFDSTIGNFSTAEGICRSGDDGLVRLEDIPRTENERLVAVQVLDERRFYANIPELRSVFRLQRKALLDLKLIPVIMNDRMWANRNNDEIQNYVLSEINRNVPNPN